MQKFDVDISISVKTEYNGGQLFYETISAKSVPLKIIAALLTWIFKLTEGYDASKR